MVLAAAVAAEGPGPKAKKEGMAANSVVVVRGVVPKEVVLVDRFWQKKGWWATPVPVNCKLWCTGRMLVGCGLPKNPSTSAGWLPNKRQESRKRVVAFIIMDEINTTGDKVAEFGLDSNHRTNFFEAWIIVF